MDVSGIGGSATAASATTAAVTVQKKAQEQEKAVADKVYESVDEAPKSREGFETGKALNVTA